MKKRIIATAAGLAAAATVAATATNAFGAPARTASLPVANFSLNGKTVTAPSSIPSGAVTLSTTVTGEKEGVLGLVKLNPGVTVQQAFGLVQSRHGDPNALQGYASIVASAAAPKGTSTVATVLTPGNYAAIDFAPNGKPPVSTFTVTQSSNSTALPAAAGTVKEIEFAFKGPSTWRQGSVMRFENGGYVVHMTVGASFKDRADAVKAATLLEAGKDSSAEKLATGEDDWFDSNSPGAVQQETIAQKPGWYVIACFMATGDGREHTRLGMEKVIHIVK